MTTEYDNSTIVMRVRNTTVDKIAKILKANPLLKSPAGVIDLAVDQLEERGVGK